MGKRGRVGEIIRVLINSLKHQMEKERPINFFGERERERDDLMGMGKTHGRWRDVSERERECVRENELDRRKDIVDLWVRSKFDVTIFGGG